MAQALIRDIIKQEGPITVERFMALALGHYYAKGTAFGRTGDFTTAPEISQVFGELIGIWCCLAWEGLGKPDPFLLVELGPGRGTLMADLLRAAKAMPGFLEAARIHLVETSPALRQAQAKALPSFKPIWRDRFEDAPQDLPLILVANEFLDALPIRQFVRTASGEVCERLVALDDDDRFVFALSPETIPGCALPAHAAQAQVGDVVETCPQAAKLTRDVAFRLGKDKGAALFIDYGPGESGVGDSLQAVKGHSYARILQDVGEADLTAHVDFAEIARQARKNGVLVHGPTPQGVWLQRMGIVERTRQLAANAPAAARDLLLSGSRRLIEPREMGTLFKVLALTSADSPAPMGFESI